MTSQFSRRNFLCALGAASVAGIAGCGSQASPGSSTGSPTQRSNDSRTPTGTGTPSSTPSTTSTPSQSSTSLADHPDVDVVDDFEDLSKWSGITGSVEAAPDRSVSGSQSLRATAEGTRTHVGGPLEADLSGRKLSVAVDVVRPTGFVVVVLRLYAPDEDNVVEVGELVRPTANQGWVRLDLGTRRMLGLPELSNVTRVEVELLTNSEGPMEAYVDGLYSVPSLDKGYVALTFDDSLAAHYTEAHRVLSEHGLAGTVGTVTNRIDTDGHLTLDQMGEMQSDGWEFASHTANHVRLVNLDADELHSEVIGARNWLQDHGFEAAADHLVFPQGAFDRRTMRFVTEHLNSASRYVSTEGATSGRTLDPYTVSRGNGARVDAATKMVDRAVAYDEMAAFTFHDIGGSGSLNASVEAFERFVAHVAQSDAEVVMLSDLVKPPFTLD